MRLIDADELKAYMQDKYDIYDHTLADINAQPTVDAEPVVRCEACKYIESKFTWYCWRRQNIVNADDFCSWGERNN